MENNKQSILDLQKLQPQEKDGQKARENFAPEEISWETEEFEYHEKNTAWFLTFGIVFFGAFVALLILKNIFGAATILFFAVILYLYAAKKPEVISVKVNYRGVTVKQKHIPYSEITFFWIHYEPPLKYLIIVNKRNIMPKITVPLGNADPVKLREALLENGLMEKEIEESLSEVIFRKLKF